MTHRFYTIAPNGVRSVSSDIACDTDFAAMIQGRELLGSNASVEIWHGTRFVGEIGQSFSRWSRYEPSRTARNGEADRPSPA